MPVYVRGQSRDRPSQANMGKLFGTNAPGITLNDKEPCSDALFASLPN